MTNVLPTTPPTSPAGSVTPYSGLGQPIDLDETAAELVWPLSVWTYDKMRRTDPQIGAILRALTLPLRRDIWRLDPAAASPDVVAHVSSELGITVLGGEPVVPPRNANRFQWREHVRLALLCLPMGHSCFELTYNIDDDGVHLSGGQAGVDYRPSTTMALIRVGPRGELQGISQYVPNARGGTDMVPIDRSRLVWYTNDREGAAWAGLSILRPAYGPWKFKVRNFRGWSITNERNGMGIPGFEAPDGATKAQISELQDYASKMRVGEFSGGAWPHGAKLTLTGVSGTLPDTGEFVRYCDEQMARMVLASFLQLGSGPNGSRALASAQIDFFTLALEAVGSMIAETATTDIVERLVDYQFGLTAAAPRIITLPPDDAPALAATDLAALVRYGVIVPDAPFSAWVRGRYNMPAADPDTAVPAPMTGRGPGAGKGWGDEDGGLRIAASAGQSKVLSALADALDVAAVVRAATKGVKGAERATAVRAALTATSADTEALALALADLRARGYRAGAAKVTKDAPKRRRAAEGDEEPPEARDPRRRLGILLAGAAGVAAGIVDTARARAAAAVDSILDDDPTAPTATLVSAASSSWAPLTAAAAIAATEMSNARRTGIVDEAVVAADEASTAAAAAPDDPKVIVWDKVPTGKQWVLGENHEEADECDENVEAGTIDLDASFPHGEDPHPNCGCDIEVVWGAAS